MENVNDLYFDGFYKEIWRQTVPEQVTIKETKFLIDFFDLNSESQVLDLMCGYGRHSIALAREGISVIAVDNLRAYTDEVQEEAGMSKLPITVVNANILDVSFHTPVDLSICMGNSLNFFPEADIISILSKICATTKTGGSIVINTWSVTEIVAKGFIQKHWDRYQDIILMSESKYLFQPTRIVTETTVLREDKVAEVKSAVDYVFSISEFETILEKAGFVYQETFSIPGKKNFEIGDPRAYIIGKKA